MSARPAARVERATPARDRRRAARGCARTARSAPRRRDPAPATVVEPEEADSTPRSASAGSSVSRCRSEPPIPPMRWTCRTFICVLCGASTRSSAPAASSASRKSVGDAVARRADEADSGERLVGEHGKREDDEPPRRRRRGRRAPARRERTCTAAATRLRIEPCPESVAEAVVRGSHSMRTACAASFAFSPGWSRTNRQALCW